MSQEGFATSPAKAKLDEAASHLVEAFSLGMLNRPVSQADPQVSTLLGLLACLFQQYHVLIGVQDLRHTNANRLHVHVD